MTFKVTPIKIRVIPISKLLVNFSWNISTLISTATTGSRAPKIDTGVDPIYLIAYTRQRLEITVVRNAKIRKLKKISAEGIANDS
jgi:hypothetical protein